MSSSAGGGGGAKEEEGSSELVPIRRRVGETRKRRVGINFIFYQGSSRIFNQYCLRLSLPKEVNSKGCRSSWGVIKTWRNWLKFARNQLSRNWLKRGGPLFSCNCSQHIAGKQREFCVLGRILVVNWPWAITNILLDLPDPPQHSTGFRIHATSTYLLRKPTK